MYHSLREEFESFYSSQAVVSVSDFLTLECEYSLLFNCSVAVLVVIAVYLSFMFNYRTTYINEHQQMCSCTLEPG